MQQPDNKNAITRDTYDAVLFDLDGVITDTATIHATCWKQMFDAYLQQRAADTMDDLFEVRVDGNTVREQHLAGKPAPDTYLMAAKLLGADPTRSVVVEDAISGVQAGRNGNFGCVIGVARQGNAEELRRHGAHLAVHDLGELVH
jgi:beta-phosphoglucomutase-like phosphatase (HAD superfamily)